MYKKLLKQLLSNRGTSILYHIHCLRIQFLSFSFEYSIIINYLLNTDFFNSHNSYKCLIVYKLFIIVLNLTETHCGYDIELSVHKTVNFKWVFFKKNFLNVCE